MLNKGKSKPLEKPSVSLGNPARGANFYKRKITINNQCADSLEAFLFQGKRNPWKRKSLDSGRIKTKKV